MNVPVITRTDKFGHCTAAFPDPPSREYPVSHEVIEAWIEGLNRVADLRERLHQAYVIRCSEALRLLDGEVAP